MKSTLGVIIMALLFCTSSAQAITANDSISTGPDYNQMVFYSLSTGIKTSSCDTDWHLAVTVRPTQYPSAPLGGTTIRFNEALGMRVYIAPNANAASFNTLDTTGWQSWRRLHDSDSAVDWGAFNIIRNPSNIFDFGWGHYDPVNHNVVGDSIFLIQLPDGELKKFLVVALVYDTSIDLQYANIDNLNFQTAHIGKIDYPGKEFVYLNLYDNVIHDKEPLSSDWDIEALRYAASFPARDSVVSKTGVWINKGVSVARADDIDINNDYYFNHPFTDSLGVIGWNWQLCDSATQICQVQDSLAYFIRNHQGQVYKVIFTAFRGSSTGVLSFYKEPVGGSSTDINTVTEANPLNLYPNPVNTILNIAADNAATALIKVFDITGNLLSETRVMGNTMQLNTSSFPDGIYLLHVSIDDKPAAYSRFVVSH